MPAIAVEQLTMDEIMSEANREGFAKGTAELCQWFQETFEETGDSDSCGGKLYRRK